MEWQYSFSKKIAQKVNYFYVPLEINQLECFLSGFAYNINHCFRDILQAV